MITKFLRVSVALAATVPLYLPATALAYLSPEQVFGGSSITLDAPPPPTAREGESVIQTQQERSAERRALEQTSLQPVDAEPEDTYVPAPQEKNLLDDNVQYELRMDRIQEQQGTGPTIIIGGQGTVVDAKGNVLHSGAPLVTSTGPETVFAVAAMVLAAVSTLSVALIRSRKIAQPL